MTYDSPFPTRFSQYHVFFVSLCGASKQTHVLSPKKSLRLLLKFSKEIVLRDLAHRLLLKVKLVSTYVQLTQLSVKLRT